MRGASAVVLAGGRATRLGALAQDTPKPLLPVAGAPFLLALLGKLRREGFDDLIVVLGHRVEVLTDFLERSAPTLGVVRKAFSAAGTGQAFAAGLRLAIHDEALLLNGDTILDVDYGDVMRKHLRQECAMTLVTTSRADVPNEGAVRVSRGGEVVAFMEDESWRTRPAVRERLRRAGRDDDRFESNCGCYAVSVDAMAAFADTRGSFERTVIPELACEGKVRAYSAGSRLFLDFGTPDRLATVARHEADIRRIYGL